MIISVMKVGSAKAFIPVTQGDALGQASLPGNPSVLCQSPRSSGWKEPLLCKNSAAKRSAGRCLPSAPGEGWSHKGAACPYQQHGLQTGEERGETTRDSAWISGNSAASQMEPLSACWKRNAPRDQAGEVAYCSSLQELKHTRPTSCCFHIRSTANCNKPL